MNWDDIRAPPKPSKLNEAVPQGTSQLDLTPEKTAVFRTKRTEKGAGENEDENTDVNNILDQGKEVKWNSNR